MELNLNLQKPEEAKIGLDINSQNDLESKSDQAISNEQVLNVPLRDVSNVSLPTPLQENVKQEVLSKQDFFESVDTSGRAESVENIEMPIELNNASNIESKIEDIRNPVDLSSDIFSPKEDLLAAASGDEQIHLDQNRHNLFNSRENAVISIEGIPSAKSLSSLNSKSIKEVGFSVNSEMQNMQLDLLRTNIYYTKKLYEELHDLKVTIKLQSYLKYLVSGVVLLSIIMSSYYAMKLFSGLFQGTGFGDFFMRLLGQNSGIQANLFGNPASSGSENLLQGSNLDTLKNTLGQVPDAYKEKLAEAVKNFLK